MPPDPHGKDPQPAGGEKRQATEGATDRQTLFEQIISLRHIFSDNWCYKHMPVWWNEEMDTITSGQFGFWKWQLGPA